VKEKVTPDVLEKIQKLFQLGTSPNMNEAAAAIKKAEMLMEKYDLSYGEVNYIVDYLKMPGKKCYDWMSIIWTEVCFANNCAPASARGYGSFSCTGRKINVFLSKEMFNYLCETVKRMAIDQCKGKGHKYNHDFKLAAAYTLRTILRDYGDRVSWAVDRDEEIKKERYFRKLPMEKKYDGDGFIFMEAEAVHYGQEAGKNISLHKQAGIEETKLIGA
jgi:hypothetical protein